MCCVDAEANTFARADSDVISVIGRTAYKDLTDFNQTAKGMLAVITSDSAIMSCYDDITSVYNEVWDFSGSTSNLIYISSVMLNKTDEETVNAIIRIDISSGFRLLSGWRTQSNFSAGSCSNVALIVDYSKKLNAMMDELVSALQSAQRKLGSKGQQ